MNQNVNAITKPVTEKLNWKWIAGTAATIAAVLLMMKLFTKVYITNTGEVKTKFVTPNLKADEK